MADNLADLLAEQERRKGNLDTGYTSVLDKPSETTTLDEFKNATEALLKGGAKGIVDLAGGWGNVYDAFKNRTEPSALSSTGITNAIARAGGPDLMKISGYKGAYTAGQAGAPAMLLSAGGMPGLFGRTGMGIAAEGAVAGGTGLLSQTVAPDSELAQFAMQSLPYVVGGGIRKGQAYKSKPSGDMPINLDELSTVGRMTPGEASGNRPQLAKEATIEATPKIEERANVFRKDQAKDVEGFLTDVFKRATPAATDAGTASNAAIESFKNYGKALSGRLRKDAASDFNAAKKAGGLVDTSPILSVVEQKLAAIPPEVGALDPLRNALTRIKDEYLIPGTEATSVPSAILDASGQPSSVKVTPATPASNLNIDIDRLQKNLSAWGEAAYSGKADFGKGNIFEGVAPGQAKGIAISVLGGFREALDNAIANGVPGADKLVKARDNFKANLGKIEEFSNRPLAKYFDVETASALTPENVITKLGSAKPSERAFLVDVLSNHPLGGEVWDTVRRSKLDEVIAKSSKAAAGAPEGAASLDLKVLLKELNNSKGDFGYLLNTADEKASANLAIQWLQKVQKTASEMPENTASPYAGGRAVGIGSQGSFVLSELGAIVNKLLERPIDMADVFFNKDTVKTLAEAQKRGFTKKSLDATLSALKTVGTTAVRAGPRFGSTTQPETPQEAAPVDDLDALLEEQKRREAQ
jgi:hypothetical protein